MTPPLSKKEITTIRRGLKSWFLREGRDYPWRRTTDPYAILVSEVMLQQTQISTVLDKGYYQRWMQQFPDLESLAKASEQDVLRAWEGLGYYRRARNLQQLARQLSRTPLPSHPEQLATLPGIGPYTAGAIASFAFNAATAAVDANIARVLSRLLNFRENIDAHAANAFLWQVAQTLVPRSGGRIHNAALMELGQRLCTPKSPSCQLCPVASACRARPYHPEALPLKKSRKATERVSEHTLLALDNEHILLLKETGSRRTGLWKLPTRPATSIGHLPLLLRTHYHITHYRVELHVHRPRRKPATQTNEHWIASNQLQQLPMPSPYRKALKTLGIACWERE